MPTKSIWLTIFFTCWGCSSAAIKASSVALLQSHQLTLLPVALKTSRVFLIKICSLFLISSRLTPYGYSRGKKGGKKDPRAFSPRCKGAPRQNEGGGRTDVFFVLGFLFPAFLPPSIRM